MDKRYLVFVSSTFRDLSEERRAVMEALLEMDAIPAGMELFPAANEDAWTLIGRVIAEADYYVLIIGGKYGSTDEKGISFTEREYDLAAKSGVPILPFLHEKPGAIPADKTELNEAARDRLAAFRKRVEGAHHCKYWNDPEQLGSRVSRAMMQAVRSTPRTGWVRADESAGPEALAEMNRLRLKIDELSEELRQSRVEAPRGSEGLLQGADPVPLTVEYKGRTERQIHELRAQGYSDTSWFPAQIPMSWDEVFATVGPLMFHEATEKQLKSSIVSRAVKCFKERVEDYRLRLGEDVVMADDTFQAIKVQLVALGLIRKTDRKRAVSDTATYWSLTPFGEAYLMRLRAMRKDQPVAAGSALPAHPDEATNRA